MSIKPPVVWCVSGSDSSAYAGLQADFRTGQDLGCHVQSIVTCTTTQNAKALGSVEPVSLAMFDKQWQSMLEDGSPDAIKVSLLPSLEIVKACSNWLKLIKTFIPKIPVIFDPVMAVKRDSENQLQESTNAGAGLLEYILPYVDVITPNLKEFSALTGLPGELPVEELLSKMTVFFDASESCWLLKGGCCNHSDGVTDWLIERHSLIGFTNSRLAAFNTRDAEEGFSTALASFIAHGYELMDAITMAKAYMAGVLSGVDVRPLESPGWPLKIESLPTIVSPYKPTLSMSQPFAKMDLDKMGLYPVVDSVAWLELVLQQGVKIAQLRIKNPADVNLESKIQQAIALGRKYAAQVFINDYWQQAIAFGAYGVHLGQEDLEVADLVKIQAAGLRLGISTHGYYEIARAQSIQPSYIALGHIFPTQTKDMPSQPQGLTRLNYYAALLKSVYPTVAIGGINAERLPAVAKTGVDSVALVTAITQADEPKAATQSLITLFEQSTRGEQ